ncbi:hypothetical protein RPB_4711 [Rhodopseudomonas palustris HaA2]|uniref:Uncharacterized protein n=1 Tax=Rhodopseudomonas palustris (strain HaA2) TaxID=316058 RepID=Q2IQW6_RHOP2|nr:hypothetical protein RPB_4711 [Rhodopseudomonas palustris HaA2]
MTEPRMIGASPCVPDVLKLVPGAGGPNTRRRFKEQRRQGDPTANAGLIKPQLSSVNGRGGPMSVPAGSLSAGGCGALPPGGPGQVAGEVVFCPPAR